MCRELYIIRENGTEKYDDFSKRVLSSLREFITHNSVSLCKVSLTTEAPPKLSIIPFRKTKLALVSIEKSSPISLKNPAASKKPTAAHQKDLTAMKMISKIPGFSGAYHANTTLPCSYHRNWPDGCFSPGYGLLTLFRKKSDIDYDCFYERWFESHTPLSLRVHPLWNYVRNAVAESLDPSEAHYDGIVEEHFHSKKDLTNPVIFFSGVLRMPFVMLEVNRDINSFIERGSIEPFLVREYYLKSGHTNNQ